MPDVTIDSAQSGKLQRQFASESELFEFVKEWVVQHDLTIEGTVTIGSSDLFCMKAGSTYAVRCRPDGLGEAAITVRWVSG